MISEIANAIAAALGVAKPLVDAAVANRFERMRDELTETWQQSANSGTTADDVVFIERVLAQAGHSAGLVSAGDQRAVPTSHLNQLVNCAIELAVMKKEGAAIQETLRKGIG